ncbi:MAG: methyltransferase domain-containing protein [Thermoanaerobaculia bacterium]|nr:methyltransferase domain-containing protein [Thermoanaerobaculia bacterium]
MDRATVLALSDLNRRFYEHHAADFRARRTHPWPGWEELLPLLEAELSASEDPTILDVGCGHGRFVTWLRERLDRRLRSLELDRSLALLSAVPAGELRGRCLAEATLVDGGLPIRDAGYDVVAIIGAWHHIPGLAVRRALLAACSAALRPGGLLLLSAWRFAHRRRFRARVVPWELALPGFHSRVEPGDYLLRWGDAAPDGEAGAVAEPLVRYCHHTTRRELASSTGGLPLELLHEFEADGDSGDLNLYQLHRRVHGPEAAPG